MRPTEYFATQAVMNPPGNSLASSSPDSQGFLFLKLIESLNKRRFACKIGVLTFAFASGALIAFGIDQEWSIWAALPAVVLLFLDASLASRSRRLASIATGAGKEGQKLAQAIEAQAPGGFKREMSDCLSGLIQPSVIFYYLAVAISAGIVSTTLKVAKVEDEGSRRANRLPPVQVISPQSPPFAGAPGIPPSLQPPARRQGGAGIPFPLNEAGSNPNAALKTQAKKAPFTLPQGNAGTGPTRQPQTVIPKPPAASQTAPVQGAPSTEVKSE